VRVSCITFKWRIPGAVTYERYTAYDPLGQTGGYLFSTS